jgi:hypothetical protein
MNLTAAEVHEISESTHRIMNPFSLEKLLLLGEICRVGPTDRILDLASGKGEMLCQFAQRHGAGGIGVDRHPPFLADARARAAELGVEDKVRFVEADAGDPGCAEGNFDLVTCIGASWIGGGLAGTLRLMEHWRAPGSTLLVGEPYWTEEPPAEVRGAEEDRQTFADLGGTLDRFEEAGVDLVEMVLASPDDWDRYAASQWLNVADWLAADPGHPDADEVRAFRDASRREYLSGRRRYFGWGVFVLR